MPKMRSLKPRSRAIPIAAYARLVRSKKLVMYRIKRSGSKRRAIWRRVRPSNQAIAGKFTGNVAPSTGASVRNEYEYQCPLKRSELERADSILRKRPERPQREGDTSQESARIG